MGEKVMGIKEGTGCAQRWVMCEVLGDLPCTPEANITL